jgi:hypothetical protein
MSNVVKLEPVELGERFRLDPDEILDAAKGIEFSGLVILGELPDGEIYIAGIANAGETLVLMERAKRYLVFGED